MLKAIILFTALIGSTCEASLESRFQEFYWSNKLSLRHCGENVSHFIRYLSDKNEFDPSISVLKITAPGHAWTFGNVLALNARGSDLEDGNHRQTWDFHFVLVSKGRVFDFSFDQNPRVLPLQEYFMEMYVPKKPLMVNGPSFRTRGQGPNYTADHAMNELKSYEFKVFRPDAQGKLTLLTELTSLGKLLQFFEW